MFPPDEYKNVTLTNVTRIVRKQHELLTKAETTLQFRAVENISVIYFFYDGEYAFFKENVFIAALTGDGIGV